MAKKQGKPGDQKDPALEARVATLEQKVEALETAAAQPEEAKKRGWWSWFDSEPEDIAG
jgi:hypothetical protein